MMGDLTDDYFSAYPEALADPDAMRVIAKQQAGRYGKVLTPDLDEDPE